MNGITAINSTAVFDRSQDISEAACSDKATVQLHIAKNYVQQREISASLITNSQIKKFCVNLEKCM